MYVRAGPPRKRSSMRMRFGSRERQSLKASAAVTGFTYDPGTRLPLYHAAQPLRTSVWSSAIRSRTSPRPCHLRPASSPCTARVGATLEDPRAGAPRPTPPRQPAAHMYSRLRVREYASREAPLPRQVTWGRTLASHAAGLLRYELVGRPFTGRRSPE